MCLNFGTPKTINFPFGTNGKFMVLDVPILKQNIGTPKTINFPFGTNGKFMVLDVPILKHYHVLLVSKKLFIAKCTC